MNQQAIHWYALTFHSGLSHGKVHDLFETWSKRTSLGIQDLFLRGEGECREAGLSAEECEGLSKARSALGVSGSALEPLQAAGLSVLTCEDDAYPSLMKRTLGRSRPPLLFCAGNLDLLQRPSVAMIGSRRATHESLEFTRTAATVFARGGLTVVSGFAEGVDRCASGAALDAQGSTILVLAQGILTFATEQMALSEGIDAGRILVVSAFQPRTGWETPLAMARNAMITALAGDVVVGQAGPKGGSWEASRMALNQGKRLWIRKDEGPDLGHRALANLGGHLIDWPSDIFETWAGNLVATILSEQGEIEEKRDWSEKDVMNLLRTASAPVIHDVSGLTGRLLTRIIEGRQSVALNRLRDLRKIKGLGPKAVQDVARAFGLETETEKNAQPSLFPEIEEFGGWDGELSTPAVPIKQAVSSGVRAGILKDAFGVEAGEESLSDGEEKVPKGEESISGAATQSKKAPWGQAAKLGRRRKNVLLILASGLRADVLGAYGSPALATPNLDSLAAEGALFQRAYTTTPQDTPSRASLLTGMPLVSHGVWTDGLQLSENTPTLATHLAARGYRTAWIGKMHLGPFDAPTELRSKESLEYWQTGVMSNWTGPAYGFNQLRLVLGHGEQSLEQGHYGERLAKIRPQIAKKLSERGEGSGASQQALTSILGCDKEAHSSTWIADFATGYMAKYGSDPFFLVASFPDPHPPYAPMKAYADRFSPSDMSPPVGGERELAHMPPHFLEAWNSDKVFEGMAGRFPLNRFSAKDILEMRARYLASTAQVDEAVGLILERLEKLGLAEDTLVVFASEMGDLLGDHGLVGSGPFHYEGLIRVPFIWRLPGVIPAGKGLDSVASLLDFAPTTCAFLGEEIPAYCQGAALDGYIEGKTGSPREAALVEFPSRYRRHLNLKTAVTRSEKLTHYSGQPHGEYFNLREDPEEMENRYDNLSHTSEVRSMEHLLLDLLGETDYRRSAPMCEE